MFHRAQLDIPLPGISVPVYVSDALKGADSIRSVASFFFSNIHPWMPLISKSWFYNHLLNPWSLPQADSTLLLLAIRLLTWIPSVSDDPRTALYAVTKRFFQELEAAGYLSIRLIQAGIFIGLYELGHCIYPAAYLSVGVCSRHAVALGFDKYIKPDNTTALSWDKVEERRRVWWAILILDRFMNLGNPSRMLATSEPSPSDILPADDISWNQGSIPCSGPSTIDSPTQLKMGRFARFAQATHLLGQVIRHASDQTKDSLFYDQETAQLNRTLHALVNLSQSEAEKTDLEFCTQTAVCYCALLILECPPSIESDTVSTEDHFDNYPIIGPQAIATRTAMMSQNFLPGGSIPLIQVSPFILHLLYRGCIILRQISPYTQREDEIRSLAVLEEALDLLSGRWLASGSYLEILRAREAMLEV